MKLNHGVSKFILFAISMLISHSAVADTKVNVVGLFTNNAMIKANKKGQNNRFFFRMLTRLST